MLGLGRMLANGNPHLKQGMCIASIVY